MRCGRRQRPSSTREKDEVDDNGAHRGVQSSRLLVSDAVHGGVLDGSGEEIHLFEGGENVRARSDASELAVHAARTDVDLVLALQKIRQSCSFDARLSLDLSSGETLEREVAFPLGDPENALSREAWKRSCSSSPRSAAR